MMSTQQDETMAAITPVPSTRRRFWSVLPIAASLLGVLVLVLSLALVPRPQPAAATEAPDFTLPLASGHGSLSLHALRGHPVLVNFFGSTCPPCISEAPVLRQAAATYRSRHVVVLGVATDGDTLQSARRFARAHHLTYPIVVDEHQAVSWQYGLVGWPASFFVDAQGRIQAQVMGTLTPVTIRAGLAQAGALSCGTCRPLERPTPVATSGISADVLFTPARPAPSFALPDQQGRIISPSALRGKVIALTFLSARCRSQCPLAGRTLSTVAHLLGRDARRFAIVVVSADPEHDMPYITYTFADESGWHGLDWHYLSAPRSLLSRVWSAYHIYVQPSSPSGNDDPVHSAALQLIDPQGRLVAYYDAPFQAPRVSATIRALLGHS